MAQKRMFDKTITNSDDFLELPDSSQVLYFHLNMNADDDGFVNNWKSIIRMTGTKEDDLKILIAKSFVIPFDSGVIVIKHWRINNYLRNDRYKETNYKQELSMLNTNDNGEYLLSNNDIGIPLVYPVKNSIDKNSIEENRIVYNTSKVNDNFAQEFELIWSKYPNKKGKDNARKDFIKARKEGITYDTIDKGLDNYIAYVKLNKIEARFIAHGSTWMHQRRWNDEYTGKDVNVSSIITNTKEYQDMLKEGLIK